jgi:rhamnose utilization protein RhaD (predicted bifunctional aldolase and dehydrogenase)
MITTGANAIVKYATPPRPSLRPGSNEIHSLLDLSARLGRDPLLVQANNGNTSIKLGGVLWIKASGKWLANAKQEESFVSVELAMARQSLRRNVEIAPALTSVGQLRPSIETAMHAVLHHPVVLHVHSVNTIAWAIRKDGSNQIGQRLAGLKWGWVPYVPSGIPLAREIERIISTAPETNIFVLGNHGLVVCANDCDQAELLLNDVEKRLAVVPRPAPEPPAALSAMISGSSQWSRPDHPELHGLGTDSISHRILSEGILYPCQAMFLGPKAAMLPHSVALSQFAEYFNSPAQAPIYAVIEGAGVLLNRKISSAEHATLIGLAQVVRRVDESAPLRFLTTAEVAGVLGGGTYNH